MRYRSYRWPCRYDVQITTPSGRAAATVINISDTGARIEGHLGIPNGTAVTLLILSQRIKATVMWQRDGLAGLRFPIRLGENAIDTVRGTGRPRWGHSAHA